MRGIQGKCDRWEIIEYLAPSTVRVDTGGMNAGEGARECREGHSGWALFTMTPESDGSHHFFWSINRNWATDNDEFTKMQTKFVGIAFREDQDVLEAQQINASFGNSDGNINLAVDKGGQYAKRMLEKLVQAEGQIEND